MQNRQYLRIQELKAQGRISNISEFLRDAIDREMKEIYELEVLKKLAEVDPHPDAVLDNLKEKIWGIMMTGEKQ